MNDQHPRRHVVRGHTPGPWHVNPASPREIVAEAPASETHRMLVVADAAIAPNRVQEDEEFRANARLIASAPELLQAAEALLKLWDAPDEHRDDARYDDDQEWAENLLEAAVQKARKEEAH